MSIRVWFAGSMESETDLTLIIPPKQPYLKLGSSHLSLEEEDSIYH
jgi:hypothetical protein